MDVLRERNKDLQARVQELDLQLFQSLVRPIQTRLIGNIGRSYGHKRILESDDEQFEDAREEASQMTTDSEDKHSSAEHDSLPLPSKENRLDLSKNLSSVNHEDVQMMVSLYEKQFEKMKV